MKNFFSLKGKFNIFFVTGLFLIFLSMYLNFYNLATIPTITTLTFIGLLIGFFPAFYESIADFKESRKINPIIMPYVFAFIALAIIVVFDFFNF